MEIFILNIHIHMYYENSYYPTLLSFVDVKIIIIQICSHGLKLPILHYVLRPQDTTNYVPKLSLNRLPLHSFHLIMILPIQYYI